MDFLDLVGPVVKGPTFHLLKVKAVNMIKVNHADLKGQFTPKSKIHISPLTCRAIYQSRSEVFNRGSAAPRGSAEVLQGGREISWNLPTCG